MADPQVEFPDLNAITPAGGTEEPNIRYFPTEEQATARQTFVQNHPQGPVEAQAALSAADYLSPVIHPAITAQHPDIVSGGLYGKPMKATGLFERLKNTVEDVATRREIASLTTPRFFGSTANDEKIAELKKGLHPAEQTVKELPKQIIDSLVGLGMQFKAGIEGSVGMSTGAAVGGMLLGPLGVAAGGAAGAYVPLREQFDATVSAQFDAMMDWKDESGKPVNANVARGISLGMGALMTGLNMVKIGEIPGVAEGEATVGKALVRAAMKVGLSGKAGALVMGAAEQGALGGAITGANLLATEFAKTLTQETNIPHQSALDILKAMGISAGAQTVVGLPLAAAGAVDMTGPVGREVQKSVAGIHEVPIGETKVGGMFGAPDAGAAPHEAPAPHPIEVATTEKLATATVGDLMEKAPGVPREGISFPITDTQRAALREEGLKPDQIESLANGSKTIRQIIDERIPKDTPSTEAPLVGGLFAGSHQDAIDAARGAADDRLTAIMEGRNPDTEKSFEIPRMTEAEGAALDAATQSAEGTSDYIEKRPEIERMNVQIEDLQAKVAAGKEEFKAQLDVAKAEKVAAVKSLRDQMAKRAEINGIIKRVQKVDTSEMSDKYKAPIEALRNSFNYNTPTEKTLTELRDLREQLRADPEKKFPEEQLARLEKLDRANWRQLSPEDMRLVHDAIMAYKNEWTHEHNVFLGDQRVEKQKAVFDTVTAIKGRVAPTESKTLKSEGNLTKTVLNIQHAVFDGLTELENMNTGVAMVAGEDSLLMSLQRKIREGHDSKREWQDRLAKPINDWFHEQDVNQRHWFREKTRFEVPSTDPMLHNMADITRGEKLTIWGLAQQEGGRDSLLNGIGLRRSKNPDVPVQIEPALLDAILGSVTDEEKSFMMDAFKKTTDMAWPELSKAFVKRYGREPVGVEGFYFMIDRMKGYIRGGADDPFAKQFKDMYSSAVSKAHLTTRQASEAPVNVAPIQDLLQDHIQWASNYIALANPIAEFNKVITDKTVGNTMREKYGNDQIQKKIIMGLNREAGAYIPTNFLDKFAGFFTRRGVTRGLGFNFASALINRILGVRAATYVRPGYVARGIVYSVLHPRKTSALLSSAVPLYREIAQKGASWEMAEAQTKTLAGKVADITFIPLKWGVRKAVQGEMLGSIWDATDQMDKGTLNDVVRRNTGLADEQVKGLSPEEKQLHAGRNAARVTEDTHATVRPYTQSFLAQHGGILKFITAFNSEMNAGLNTIVRTAMDMKRGNPKALGRLITAAVILGITEPTMVWMIRTARATATGKPEDWSAKGIALSWTKEEMMNLAGFVPTGADFMYRVEQLINPKTRRQPTGRGGVGLLGQNVDATLQIIRDAYQVAGGRNQEKAKIALVMDIADEVAGMAAGVSISRELRNMTGFYKTMKGLSSGLGVDLPELPGGGR